LKGLHFSSHAEVVAAAETWFDSQPSEFFFSSGLQKLEFGRCSFLPSFLVGLRTCQHPGTRTLWFLFWNS